MKKLKLSVTIGTLHLDVPIVCASGTFGYGQELKGLVDFKGIGAIVTKTITKEPHGGNPPPRICETDHGVINSIGLENPGLDEFIADKLAGIKKLPTRCIVSVGGFSVQEYAYILRRLNALKGISAYEINLSCPNIRLKKLISQDPAQTYAVTKRLRKLTAKPLIIKITPQVTDIVPVARAAQEAGADAISLVNTFFAMAINIETRTPVLGNTYGGYSGKAIKPMSLYQVWRVYNHVQIPLIAGGGIETAEDAIEFFLAGAAAVSIGTVNFVYPNQAAVILKGVTSFMKRHALEDIKKLRGGLRAAQR